jgi:GcrA cell cycle regulator
MVRGEPWSDEDVNLLTKLWAAGETAQAIATRLGDISRSAVLGKIFRLRLCPAETGKKPNANAAAPHTSETITRRRGGSIEREELPNAKAERKGKTLFELTNACCRWPYRRPGTERYFFCGAAGADLAGGTPYCARHMKRAYLVPPPRGVETRRRDSAPARRRAAKAT